MKKSNCNHTAKVTCLGYIIQDCPGSSNQTPLFHEVSLQLADLRQEAMKQPPLSTPVYPSEFGIYEYGTNCGIVYQSNIGVQLSGTEDEAPGT